MTKHSPFSYFKISPGVMCAAVMLYVRFKIIWPGYNNQITTKAGTRNTLKTFYLITIYM
jgi:hypothetical protein